VREPVVENYTLSRRYDLRDMTQPPQRRGVENAIPVALRLSTLVRLTVVGM